MTPAIHDLVARRRSPRAYAPRPVEPAALRSLFEAARWAPSSANGQPWSFIVARGGDAGGFARLLGTLTERNQEWARVVPVLVLAVARTVAPATGKPHRHAFYDLGLAVANLITQATALGLSAHQMGGFDPLRAREAFGVPDGWEPVTVIALGYAADPAGWTDAQREFETRPRLRQPLDEFVFEDRWGQRARLLDES